MSVPFPISDRLCFVYKKRTALVDDEHKQWHTSMEMGSSKEFQLARKDSAMICVSQSKNAVRAFQITCKLLSFTFKDSFKN